jgi:hypothetical protein
MNYYTGAALVQVMPYTVGTWYNIRFEIDTDADTCDVYVDGVLRLNDANLRIPVTEISEVLFGLDGVAGNMSVDDVKVYPSE